LFLALSTDKIGLLFLPFLLACHNGKVLGSGPHLPDFLSQFRISSLGFSLDTIAVVDLLEKKSINV
jgi:hypothetical protein